jgi:hypothetical protein
LNWKDLFLAYLLRQRYHLPVRAERQPAAAMEYAYGRLSHGE